MKKTIVCLISTSILMSFILMSFILMSFTLSGCTNNSVDNSQEPLNNTEAEYLSPVLTLNADDYIECEGILYSKEDHNYYYIQNARLHKVTMKDFTSSFTDKDTIYNINFKWCEIDGETRLFYEELPEGFILKSIPGNAEAVYLGKTVRIDGDARCRICVLKNNTVEQLFQGVLENNVEDAIGIHDLSLSSDLKQAIIDYKGKAMYFDGQQLLDLGFLCGRDDADTVSAYFDEKYIIISCMKYIPNDVTQVSCYIYHPQTGNIKETLHEIGAFNNTNCPAGLIIWSHYGRYFENGKLSFTEIITGNQVSSEILLNNIMEQRGLTDSLYGIHFQDGTFAVMDASTGNIVGKSEHKLVTSSYVNMYWEHDCLYARINTDKEIIIYKIEIK